MLLHDWTTYFFAGLVVSAGLGVAYYWEHYDIVRFDEPKDKQFNAPEISPGNWRCGHLSDPIEVGNYVVYERMGDGGQKHVGRVVALADQHIEVKEKELLVDGKPFDVRGVKQRVSPCEVPELIVPRNCVFVLCDERGRTGGPETDSRCFGPISIDSITHTFAPLDKKKD